MTGGDKTQSIKKILELQERFFHNMREDDKPAAWLELNLTIAQMKSLIFIRAEGTINAKTLATFLRVTPPDVTRIVDRLVEQGLVTREENPDNRRMQILKLTKKGETLLSGLREHGPHRISGILKLLSIEDLSALHQGFSALLRAAESKKGQSEKQPSPAKKPA